MLDRDTIIQRAYNECLAEMYAKAQPPADYYQILEDYKTGKLKQDEKVYERHYLSDDEFKYILQKYRDAYHIHEHWESDINLLEKYLTHGGTKDKYVESYTDENGNYHPGYRGYEKVAPIKGQIQEIIKNEIGEGNITDKIVEKLNNAVMNTIVGCKEFYRFDREESQFTCSIALGCSPTSNPTSAIEYWEKQGVHIDIKERNPLLLWEQDYYGDDFDNVMIDEYGEDWENEWNERWKEKQRQEELEREKRWNQLQQEISLDKTEFANKNEE